MARLLKTKKQKVDAHWAIKPEDLGKLLQFLADEPDTVLIGQGQGDDQYEGIEFREGLLTIRYQNTVPPFYIIGFEAEGADGTDWFSPENLNDQCGVPCYDPETERQIDEAYDWR